MTIDFEKAGGLVAAIAQDFATNEVLMVAWMNREAYEETVRTGRACYFSRSRNRLWRKGEESGNVQEVREILIDCDADAILLKVNQIGGACLSYRSQDLLSSTSGRRSVDRDRRPSLRSEAGIQEMTTQVLKLGIPAGSLQEATGDLFRKAGYKITFASRSYYPNIDDPEIHCTLIRAQEMPRYVQNGSLDCGLTGYDWVLENDAQVVELAELVFSKVSRRPVRWVLAVPNDSAIHSVKDLQGKRIATEVVNLTKKWLAKNGVEAKVEFSWGATEVKPPKFADAIVEVTETGSSIRANNLRIVAELLQSTTRFIANQAAADDPWKRRKMEDLILMLRGAMAAEGRVGLMMNVRKEDLADPC